MVADIASTRDTSSDCVQRILLKWGLQRKTLLLEGQFERCYHMSAAYFDKVLSLVRPRLLSLYALPRRRISVGLL
ncbi:hypothetical protein DVH05_028013 [Phytophthora capsici]|nr:hypothetical protein DVH05_028013 [Phytophthora capsici]